MSNVITFAGGLLLLWAGFLLALPAFWRLVYLGHPQRRIRRVLLGLLVPAVVGGLAVALTRDAGGYGLGLLVAGVAYVVAAAVFLALAWVVPPARSGPPARPAPEAPREQTGRKQTDRVRYLRLGFAALMLVVFLIARQWVGAGVCAVALAMLAWAAVLTRREEVSTRADLSEVPPGAGPVLVLRSLRHGWRGRVAVLAGHLTPAARRPPSLVHPGALLGSTGSRDDWRTPTASLLRSNDHVLVFPDDTEVTRWVLDLMRREGRQEHLFVLVPGVQGRFFRGLLVLAGGWMAPWPEFAGMLRAAGLEPPATTPERGTVLGFDEHGRAVVAGVGRKTLNQMTAAVLRPPPAVVTRPGTEPNG